MCETVLAIQEIRENAKREERERIIAVVNRVKKDTTAGLGEYFPDGYEAACDDILAALKEPKV